MIGRPETGRAGALRLLHDSGAPPESPTPMPLLVPARNNRMPSGRPGWVVPALIGWVSLFVSAPLARAEPVFPGLAASQLDPVLQGQVLLEELNCAACHPGDVSLAARSKVAPILTRAVIVT